MLPITSFHQLVDKAYLEIGQHLQNSIHATYCSADLVQRSMLFDCVETKRSCMLVSVTASAAFSVNSGQLFSGKSKSAEGVISYARSVHHYYLPTAQMPLVDDLY